MHMCSADMDCSVQNIVMQMNEIDLYEKWVPLVKVGTPRPSSSIPP